MRKRINFQLMSITALAIVTTLILVSAVFYDLFEKQVFEDLKTNAHLLAMEEESSDFLQLKETVKTIRITLVDEDGIVVYDNEVKPEAMNNHKDRPEVIDAFQTGEGKSIRKSDTVDMSTFYYAIRLDGGQVLRVGRETNSLLSVLGSALPLMLFVSSVLFLVCVLLSYLLTQSLIRPIEKMASVNQSKDEIETYEELIPFIQTIRRQNEDIIKNAKIRQEFTANVSHELKTPLTSISGYSELIENHMASEEDMIRFGAEIHKNANRLLTLINDIIQLSELDSTALEMIFEEVNLYQLGKNCVEMLQMNAGKNGVALTMDGKECSLMGNKQMLEEVLYNLCDNAIRYNSEGGYVRLSIYPRDSVIVLCVEDSGIGIPKEHQERIFERFYRVDKSRSKLTGGTGLGLAIVKHIVAHHGADMKLESEVGKGTKITIEFPYNAHAMAK